MTMAGSIGASPLLEARGIRKSFAGVEVLHGVDFQLHGGEIHAVLGHNGAGKSTLMKIIAGVQPDDGGELRIDGHKVSFPTPRAAADSGIAVIYQDFALVPDMTVAENIALGREPAGRFSGLLSHRALRQRSEEEVREFGLALPMDVAVRHLGVAAKQQTEIARALAKRARILIMDEPTARLAPHERQQLFAIMRRLAQSGVGIIYISHFLEEIFEIADRVTVLRDGAVVASGGIGDFKIEKLVALLVGHDETPASQSVTAMPAASGEPVLVLENVSVRGRPPVDLSLAPGEVLAISGLIGAGRSSLARSIVGDLGFSGTLRIAGRPYHSMTPQRAARLGVVMVPEDRKQNGLVLTGSVLDNLELTALSTTLSRFGIVRRRRSAELARAAIGRFRIMPPDPEKIVGKLSGGNAQKVLLARAALAGPRVLILDQPTAGVDTGAKMELHRQIRAIAAEGVAVLLISDDLDEILDLSNRIAIMAGGSIVSVTAAGTIDRPGLLAAISRNAPQAI